jgi:hypothetical protein
MHKQVSVANWKAPLYEPWPGCCSQESNSECCGAGSVKGTLSGWIVCKKQTPSRKHVIKRGFMQLFFSLGRHSNIKLRPPRKIRGHGVKATRTFPETIGSRNTPAYHLDQVLYDICCLIIPAPSSPICRSALSTQQKQRWHISSFTDHLSSSAS